MTIGDAISDIRVGAAIKLYAVLGSTRGYSLNKSLNKFVGPRLWVKADCG